MKTVNSRCKNIHQLTREVAKGGNGRDTPPHGTDVADTTPPGSFTRSKR